MKLGQKSKKPSCSSTKLILQEIIGLTTKNANGLSSVTYSSKCVYLAGCVAVVYDVDSCTQSHLVVSHRMPKPLSCVSVSQNGRFVAAGESPNLSAVLIWDCETLGLVSELKGHLYGSQCLSFSPNGAFDKKIPNKRCKIPCTGRYDEFACSSDCIVFGHRGGKCLSPTPTAQKYCCCKP